MRAVYMQQDRHNTIITCVTPPYISFIMGLRMLFLLHACLAAYILPSSPVLLHILYCTCFSTFWHCHPHILQHFNGNVFTLLFHWFFLYRNYLMPYYVSIKANSSTVQEFCALLTLGLYGRVGAIPTYVQSVQLQEKN